MEYVCAVHQRGGGSQVDFVWFAARTMHPRGAYVWWTERNQGNRPVLISRTPCCHPSSPFVRRARVIVEIERAARARRYRYGPGWLFKRVVQLPRLLKFEAEINSKQVHVAAYVQNEKKAA